MKTDLIRKLVSTLDRRTVRNYDLSIKEVIQPHFPVGLPCYDLVPVIGLTLGVSPLAVG